MYATFSTCSAEGHSIFPSCWPKMATLVIRNGNFHKPLFHKMQAKLIVEHVNLLKLYDILR